MKNATASFIELAESLGPRIDAALDAHSRLGDGCPAVLQEAVRYSLLAPGKRVRPMLVLLAAQACGGAIEPALPAACAVEMVHAYSLIHDDLPALDNDDLRRGRPTCHKQFDEATAILAGDALLTLAFDVLAHQIQPGATAAACCAALAHAAGACNMVGGQVDDLEAERRAEASDGQRGTGDASTSVPTRSASEDSPPNTPTRSASAGIRQDASRDGQSLDLEVSLAHLKSIHARKTGAMIRVSLQLGALVAGADSQQTAALDRYGDRLGLAFQVTDDLLDVRSSEAAMGKRVNKDAARGKLTFPVLLGLDQSTRYAEQLVTEACAALQPFAAAAAGLDVLARYVLERNH